MSSRTPGSTGPLDEHAVAALRGSVAAAVLAVVPQGQGDDPAAALALVLASRTAAEETARLLQESVSHARACGHSWDVVGRLLGVSRQAAQQRFGGPGPHGVVHGDGPQRRVLTPLTALDEMAVLEREGRRGWHVVDHGPLFHVVEASDHVWEHRRVLWGTGAARALAAEGWAPVKDSTFPWSYYTRRLDRPAEA